jgi:hypothetical protein
VDFGQVVMGTTSTRYSSVSNRSGVSLHPSRSEITGGDAASFGKRDFSPYTLWPGQYDSYELRFSPRSEGVYQATFILYAKERIKPVVISLRGIGVRRVFEVSRSYLSFPTTHVDSSSVLSLGFRNYDPVAQPAPRFIVSGSDSSQFLIVRQPADSIASMGTDSITIRFVPKALGYKRATLTALTPLPFLPTKSITLSGTGDAEKIQTTPSSIDLDTVLFDNVVRATVQARNIGAFPLRIAGCAITGKDADLFIIESRCDTVLPTNAIRSITVRFLPVRLGIIEAFLEISSNDPFLPIAKVPLRATTVLTRVEPPAIPLSRPVLYPNYPNPVDPGSGAIRATTFRFALHEAGVVRLVVTDILGQVIAVPVDGWYDRGEHLVPWDCGSLAPGLYLYRMQTSGRVLSRRLIVR